MKVFYSELASNPSYYSFGYSVYGEMEPGDDLSDIYARGFLPAVIVKEQESNLFYLCRGSRVRLADFKELHKLGRVARKIEGLPGGVEVVEHVLADFPLTDEFLDFVLRYFAFRHGASSMSRERLLSVLRSPYLSHIAEYRIGGKTAAYALEARTPEFSHVWYYAYAKEYEGKHLGSYILLDAIRRAKTAGRSYAYLGVTYGLWMEYKTIYQPLEYWDGKEWVSDPKSHALKELLSKDHLRRVVFADAWRAGKTSYYSAPYAYNGGKKIVRRIELMLGLYPKFSAVCMIIVSVAVAALILKDLFV